jgi:hypothetical protein
MEIMPNTSSIMSSTYAQHLQLDRSYMEKQLNTQKLSEENSRGREM